MIHSSAIIYPGVIIDEGVSIGAYSVIGGPPEDRKYFGKETPFTVHIKKGVKISDLVTIHSGTKQNTEIGENTCIFAHSHVAHDVVIGQDCIIGGGVSLAGHTIVMDKANVSGRSGTIPYVVIGAYAFIGCFSLVTRHVAPGQKTIGFPARVVEINRIGLERSGISIDECVAQYFDKYLTLIEGRTL